MTDVAKALRQAFSLGQTYWQQADSEFVSQHRKSDETRAKLDALVTETLAELDRLRAPGAPQEAAAVPAVGQEAQDAARYRWLRRQNWHDSDVCVVVNPKKYVRLGSFCPSGLLLDQRIDFALAGKDGGEG